MAAILVILFSVILSSMTPLVFEASDQLIPIVFEVDKTLGQYLSTASSTIYNIGISLMILKFLKKGFEIYVMGTDGDPDMDPLQLVTNFIKAMAVAIGFRPIYDIFVRILKETVNAITTSMNIYKEVTDFTGIGIINGVLCLLRTIFLETTYASCSGSTPASISNFVFLRIFGAFKASPSLSPTLPMKR